MATVSYVDEAYNKVLLQIVRGELPSGTEIKSTQLARSLGCSRTPVVQALQRLAADGIVTLEINKRAVVRPGAENWLVEIHQMRELLEPPAAALAAERMSLEDIAELEALAEEARPGPGADWVEAAKRFDFALHLKIADRSGNLALGEAIRKCWGFKQLSYAAGTDRPEALESGYREHLAILTALKNRDSQTAHVAMLFHLRSAADQRPEPGIV